MKKKVKLTVRLDELPEYRAAVEWAISIRTKAEREIARDAVSVPAGALRLLDDLVERGYLSARERDAVNLWNGVGSSAGNYTLRRLMANITLLPPSGEDFSRWWMRQVSPGADRSERLNFNALKETHYACESETDYLLKSALRKCIVALLDDLPSLADLYRMLSDDIAAESDGQGRRIRLSEMTNMLNSLNRIRAVATDCEHFGRDSRSVDAVRSELELLGLDFEEDCGFIWNAEAVRDAVRRYGERARACASCLNWHVVSEGDVDYEWRSNCVSCRGSMHRAFFGADDEVERPPLRYYSWARERLPHLVRSIVEDTKDISLKVALVEGTTVNQARRMLVTGATAADAEDAGLKPCPLASSCASLCGRLQRSGRRKFPIAPFSGRYRDCHLYGAVSMTPEDAGDDLRERIASACLEQAKTFLAADKTHYSAARAIECWAAMPERDLTVGDAQENRLSVQTAMF